MMAVALVWAVVASGAESEAAVMDEEPWLEMVDGSIRFVDATGRNSINADGAYAIEFEVKNRSQRNAKNCRPTVRLKSWIPGIRIEDVSAISITPGRSTRVSVPVKSTMEVEEGMAYFMVSMEEPHGNGTPETLLKVPTHPFVAPMVVADYAATSMTDSLLRRNRPFDLQLLLRNEAAGWAEDVEVNVKVPKNVYVVEGMQTTEVGIIHGGETKELMFTVLANQNYRLETLLIEIELKEKHGYADSRLIELTFDQPLTARLPLQSISARGALLDIPHPQPSEAAGTLIPVKGRK